MFNKGFDHFEISQRSILRNNLLILSKFLSDSPVTENCFKRALLTAYQLETLIIYRDFTTFSSIILYSDSPISSHPVVSEEILAIHRLFAIALHRTQQQVIDSLNCQQFVLRLFILLATSDLQEQSLVEIIITILYQTRDELRPLVLSMINQFLNGKEQTYLVISSVLRLYNTILSANGKIITNENNIFYQTSIIPLYSAKCSSYYAPQLTSISLYFMDYSSTNIDMTVSFMINHWPYIDSSKQVAFINALYLFFKRNYQYSIHSKRVFFVIISCIKSQNYKVSLAALRFFNDPQIIILITEFKQHINSLFESLQCSRNHWHYEVASEANSVVKVIMGIIGNSYDNKSNIKTQRSEIWKKIVLNIEI